MRRHGIFHLRPASFGRKALATSATSMARTLARSWNGVGTATCERSAGLRPGGTRTDKFLLPSSSAASLLLASAALERRLIALPQERRHHRRRLLALRRALRAELELMQGLMRTLFLPHQPPVRQPA